MDTMSTSALGRWLEHVTFEIFPAAGIEDGVAEHLPRGSRVAVTHSPRHGVEHSLALATTLAASGYEPVLHIAAKGVASEQLLTDVLAELRRAEVREVFAIGGDQPEPLGPYGDATALVAAIRNGADPSLRIGVGAHPEGHPKASQSDLLHALQSKQRLGASYVATQMCFDAAGWCRWACEIEAAGVTLPLSVGVPGAVSRRKLMEIGIRAGAGPSLRALRSQRGFARRALTGGTYVPDDLLQDLAASPATQIQRIDALHVFTFNSLEATVAWLHGARAVEAAQSELGSAAEISRS
jgi:methylenetetrahydrofolate reductase (NADPH)